jgi:hypothetical protein
MHLAVSSATTPTYLFPCSANPIIPVHHGFAILPGTVMNICMCRVDYNLARGVRAILIMEFVELCACLTGGPTIPFVLIVSSGPIEGAVDIVESTHCEILLRFENRSSKEDTVLSIVLANPQPRIRALVQ